MAQRLTTSFINTVTPGAYNEVNVKSLPSGLGSSGIVAIVGEADGGDSYANVNLKNNSFGPDQLSLVEKTYIRGPIVDAFRALSAPSNDTDITGTANRIYIVKTNSGTQASSLVDTDYGTLTDKNFGKDGNKYKFQVTSIAAEIAPSVSGSTIASFGAALNGMAFHVRQNGGVSAAVTLSATPSNHSDIATLIVELNSLLPAGITASAGTATNSLKFTMTADAAAYRKGYGKSFELIDSTPGDLAAIGLTAALTTSSQEPGVEIAIVRSDIGLSETLDVQAAIAFEIGYVGTTATVTINQTTKTLTTTVVGGSGASLSVDMTQYRTIADMASYIAAQTGYSCSASAAAQQLPTTALDTVTAQGICSTAASLKPGRVKKAAADFLKTASTSVALAFTATATAGLPAPMSSFVFLTGGTKGGTLAADVVSAIDQLGTVQCNIVVPLFSRDSSADIADALTETTSTYTISAVHAIAKSHCLAFSTSKMKRNRITILSYSGAYNDAKAESQGLASYRCSMTMQKASQTNSAGEVVSFQPWYTACVAAGMQAGGFYKAIVNKFANVISFEDPAGFDSGSPSDVEDALEAGLLFLTAETAGSRWVSDQTTYGFDTNFVYNSIQAVYLSDIVALDLTDSFQKAFVGKSLADISAAVALSFLAQKMEGYRKLKMIASSDDAPLGYKNASITIVAPEMAVAVEIKLATAIYFIPISIGISQVQQSA